MTKKEIKAEIAKTKKEMRAAGIRRKSVFNGGLTHEEYRLNSRLFELETRLRKV